MSAFVIDSVVIYICQNAICTIDLLIQGLQEQLAEGVFAFWFCQLVLVHAQNRVVGFYAGLLDGQLSCYLKSL